MPNWNRKRLFWIVCTALLTALAVVLALNFVGPEKKIERKIEHRYAIADEQYRREMGVLLMDIGAGTTDYAVFLEGNVVHTNVLPVGAGATTDVAPSGRSIMWSIDRPSSRVWTRIRCVPVVAK